MYRPDDYGKKEVDLIRRWNLQHDDAKRYFTDILKPRYDRAYKLYVSYTGDRAREIKRWQANVFVPYTQAVIETLMPRILDARPEFSVQGRTEDDQLKATKLQHLGDYSWEVSEMDNTSEEITRSALVYGTGFLQVSWKKDARTHKFLKTKDLAKKKYSWKEKEQVFYDAPYCEWVDNYDLWYDWHNIPRECKQFWMKRKILTGAEIKRRYPMYDPKRMKQALLNAGGDLSDFALIRQQVKLSHEQIIKGADHSLSAAGSSHEIYQTQDDPDLRMHEVFEWWRPYEDAYAVMVNNVPILKGGFMPIPYDFKASPFIEVPYLKLPNEFEGMGLPLILESPQIMLNMTKNQRLDAMTLSIHKMWVVNPMANIDKEELVTRPFGIVYSADPAGVREIQFSDIKPSAYKEEELLKGDMRYAVGVDDFSMGVSGGAGSATEVRHLRESTLERVRLFVNHLGSAYATVLRYWITMYRQFFTEKMMVRIAGGAEEQEFMPVEKDDLMGQFDFKAKVIPSIAGRSELEKKQGMDLFQLLVNLPFIDVKKLTSKVLHPWGWPLDSLTKEEQAVPPEMLAGAEGMPPEGMPPEGMPPGATSPEASPIGRAASAGEVPMSVVQAAIAKLGGQSPFAEAGAPINLLEAGSLPPTAGPIKGNPRGLNRGGRVDTNIPVTKTYSEESKLMNRANNLQK